MSVSVYQCGRCRTVVGDSTSFLAIDDVEKMLILSSSVNTTTKFTTTTTTSSHSSHSSHHQSQPLPSITCNNCGKTLGKFHDRAKENTNIVSNSFALPLVDIISYTIGALQTADNGNQTMADAKRLDSHHSHQQQQQGQQGQQGDAIQSLNVEVDKIQHVLLNVIERLNALEQQRDGKA